MRLLVLSDSHGNDTDLRWVLEQVWKRTGRIDAYVHCGDGCRDLDRAANIMLDRDPGAFLCAVRGNCDFSQDRPVQAIIPAGETRILVTHGHLYHVKSYLNDLDDAAKANGCSIALYGHTHTAAMDMRQALLVNPGSVENGRAALIEIVNGRSRVDLLEF
ncbi:MAG: YfcE family phosphodiesterase [Clostridia bacterium]|nr:YfcE family phosphodiesterase [Clostridia bacterium]